jgi:site-specific recombinase XerC
MTPERAVDDFVDYLRAERGYSPHTVTAYRSDLTSFWDFAHSVGVEPHAVDQLCKRFGQSAFARARQAHD